MITWCITAESTIFSHFLFCSFFFLFWLQDGHRMRNCNKKKNNIKYCSVFFFCMIGKVIYITAAELLMSHPSLKSRGILGVSCPASHDPQLSSSSSSSSWVWKSEGFLRPAGGPSPLLRPPEPLEDMELEELGPPESLWGCSEGKEGRL